jgi:hypothetical protein
MAARPSRRRFLALAGGGLLVAGSAVAIVRTRGYELAADRMAKLKALAPWQAVVFDAVARRVAAADVPEEVPSTDEVGVTDFVDGYIAGMHPALRRDCLRLVGFVEHIAPILAKKASRFTKLSPSDQDKVLAKLESHDQGMLRGAFAGLKSLVFMGYYRDPRTWKIIGYTGPMVAAP